MLYADVTAGEMDDASGDEAAGQTTLWLPRVDPVSGGFASNDEFGRDVSFRFLSARRTMGCWAPGPPFVRVVAIGRELSPAWTVTQQHVAT
jgi:hypothetical protein